MDKFSTESMVKKIIPKSFNDEISEIINHLNYKTGKLFTTKNKQTNKYLSKLFRNDYSIEDIKKVIDYKTKEWLGTNMEKYLRPSTLFHIKFEDYLEQSNQKPKVEVKETKVFKSKMYDDLIKALNDMDYKEYLLTEHWLHFRKEALKFFNYKCQTCGSTEELSIHHNNYANRGRETFNDVTCLCSACHSKFHDNNKV